MASTAADIITGALLNINSYSPAQALEPSDGTVGLNSLNDLLDSLSNDEAFVYTQQETIFQWIAGQFQYTVGNPVSPTTFTGNLTSGTAFITNITTMPANIVVGSTITDLASAIPTGSILGLTPTTVIAVNATNLELSANATSNQTLDTFTYTVPGNIPIARPLRFRSGFTRTTTSGIANLDFGFEFTDFDNYKRELLKNVQGPWPYVAAYQPTFPYGTAYFYPAPGSNYTAHIFSDLILAEFASTTTPYSLPQGYTRALKKLLALELAPIYGKTPSAELRLQAKEAKDLIKGTNSTPVKVMSFDTAICYARVNDASWSQDGGFR
jgi:hypothetical protein